jgi:hypothetical protein
MFIKAHWSNLIGVQVGHGVAIIQYADDMNLCLENNRQKVIYVKLLLYMYEQMAGLKINFEKSELLLVRGDKDMALTYADIFNCQIEMFPIKYIGVPILASKLHVID